jgi:hypothetical protein
MARPSALAVLRFTTISSLFGSCTGRSPGFAPRPNGAGRGGALRRSAKPGYDWRRSSGGPWQLSSRRDHYRGRTLNRNFQIVVDLSER